jgi:hypothetical protein
MAGHAVAQIHSLSNCSHRSNLRGALQQDVRYGANTWAFVNKDPQK